jgi:hypothetical protein
MVSAGPMNLAFLIAKIAVVAFFLFMFLRSNKLSWGIGLLAVTTAILLDTFLGTFGLEEMLQQFGFFFYVIVGALFAGGALWLWGLLSPYARSSEPGLAPDDEPDRFREDQALQELSAGSVAFDQMSTDQRRLYELIRTEFSQEDVFDLIFDLGFDEDDQISYQAKTDELILEIVDIADQNGQIDELALAAERIQNSPPPEYLPRIEKIQPGSPQTILRHYLIANYSLTELEVIATEVGSDWNSIEGDNKKSKVRNLLIDLKRQDQIDQLIQVMQQDTGDAVA